MAPEKRYRPLCLLLLPLLLLYCIYQSSLHVATHEASSYARTYLKPTHDPNPLNFTLTIKVLAFDRIISLSRCLRSLASADYGGDRVNLHVYIDHFSHSEWTNDTDVSILDTRLENSRSILNFVDGFRWKHGDKMVHYRTGNAGLQAQWLEVWWPSSDNEFAFVVEDDLEVSPLYYKFLRGLIFYYYLNTTNFSPSIFGASLQRPRFVPGKNGNKMQLDDGTRLFLYQLVGTWGQLLFPRPWKEFRLWYDTKKAKGVKPRLQGMVTTGWYNKMGEKIWTPWFIKFIHSRGYFNIYTNFLKARALSVSHRDPGVNYGRSAGPDSYFLDQSNIDFNLLEMQPLSNLKWYDFCFREVHPHNIVQSFEELGSALRSLQKQGNIIFVSLFSSSEAVTNNLLCHFERLNVDNYILVGPKSGLLLDLARRGHPVIDADIISGTIEDFAGLPGWNVELTMDILLKTRLIKKCLESGYHSWLIDGNIAVARSDAFSDAHFPAYDFLAGETTELFFARSSSSTIKIWNEGFIHEALAMANSINEERTFVHIMRSLFFGKKGARVQRVDERSFGIEINATNMSVGTSLGVEDKLVFWSSGLNASLIQKRLEELGMWAIDDDFSCTSVVCHHS